MIKHTAHHTGVQPHEYYVKNANQELIATLSPRSKDLNIFGIVWYGGEKHGKYELSEGGLEGAMEFIGENA